MNFPLFSNKELKNNTYTIDLLPKTEYNNCTFINCNFENSDISNVTFLECEFIGCKFSNVNVAHTTFNDVTFMDYKIVGVLFQICNDFLLAFQFVDCTINLSSFYQLKILNLKIVKCKM